MDMASDMFSITIHHGRKFIFRPTVRYVGGQILIFDDMDPDRFSISEIESMLRDIRVSDFS